MSATEISGPEYHAVALQVSVKGVNRCKDRASSRARINENLQRIGEYTTTAASFLKFFYGTPLRLVGLPEYAVTGFPMKESPAEWRDRACLEQNGPEYEQLGRIAQQNNLYLSGNVYEIDPHFPELYFQTCFIIGPNGNVILRYRRLTSCFEPTPHDVWDKYIDVYGPESIFPVAKTEIGNLGTIASEEILYPEITRCVAMRGAEVLLHPTSEPGSAELTIKEVCRRARAIENQIFVVSSNTATIDDIPIPAYTCSAMSKIVDFNGHILAEAAQGGEAFNSNAVIDIGALRRTRRRTAMANVMSRQPFQIYADSYARFRFHEGNFLLRDGKVIEPPNRDTFRKRQEANIERLVKAGLL
ncbi:MAG: nitrilase [Gammaproteobacteria bacterium]|nr:nitrilase [Gammaproteobacteria bacterium]